MKGCEVYFPETFSWTSPLSDRKGPISTKISKTRLSYLLTADLRSRVLNQMVHLMPWITATHLRHFLYSGPAHKPSLWARDGQADIECLGDFCPDLLRFPLRKPTSHLSHYPTRLQKNFTHPFWGSFGVIAQTLNPLHGKNSREERVQEQKYSHALRLKFCFVLISFSKFARTL